MGEMVAKNINNDSTMEKVAMTAADTAEDAVKVNKDSSSRR